MNNSYYNDHLIAVNAGTWVIQLIFCEHSVYGSKWNWNVAVAILALSDAWLIFSKLTVTKKKRIFSTLSNFRENKAGIETLTEEKNQRESRLWKWIKTDGAVLFIAYKVFL